MAGNSNSGRRGAPRNEDGSFAHGSPERGAPTRPAPKLESTHESCRECSSWVFEQVANETIDNKAAEVLLAAVAKMTTSLNADFKERELRDLESLVQRQEAAVDYLKQHEALGRGAAAATSQPTTGRTRVTDVA